MEPTWSRAVLKLPLPDKKIDELVEALGSIRDAAILWLRKRRTDIDLKEEQVRANIFLADYQQADVRAPFHLFMPERLRLNMAGHPDANIRFRPGQGLTGVVFFENGLKYAQTIATPTGHQFDEVYQLTKEQKESLHPQLRWIASLALNITPPEGGPRKAVGVLNVDGLTHLYNPDDLNLLLAALTLKVAAVSDKLAGLPMARIVLTVET